MSAQVKLSQVLVRSYQVKSGEVWSRCNSCGQAEEGVEINSKKGKGRERREGSVAEVI